LEVLPIGISPFLIQSTKRQSLGPKTRTTLYRFEEVLRKMRLEHADLTSNFPSPLVVASRKTSEKKGKEGEPLTKYLRGVSIEEKDLLAADKYSIKIRNYFEKYHLGVGAAYSIFSDCVEREYDLYIPLCDRLFKTCTTETGYVSVLHNALRVFYGFYSTSEDGMQPKKTWIDHQRELANAAKLRHEVNAGHSRAEVSSNFVIAMDGQDGCSFHVDSLNCSEPSYDWTCCSATTVESESNGRLYRVVTNLNSRASCGRAMQNEKNYASFKQGLATEMKRIDASYKEIYGDRMDDLPTAQTYACLYLKDDLPWVDEIDGQGNNNRYIRMASAPSRDFSYPQLHPLSTTCYWKRLTWSVLS
jgi:hypothetical protein